MKGHTLKLGGPTARVFGKIDAVLAVIAGSKIVFLVVQTVTILVIDYSICAQQSIALQYHAVHALRTFAAGGGVRSSLARDSFPSKTQQPLMIFVIYFGHKNPVLTPYWYLFHFEIAKDLCTLGD